MTAELAKLETIAQCHAHIVAWAKAWAVGYREVDAREDGPAAEYPRADGSFPAEYGDYDVDCGMAIMAGARALLDLEEAGEEGP